MGRIKTTLVKRISFDIFNKHGSELKNNFEENKKIIEKFVELPSKKIRNTIAGYVTRLVKTKKEI